ncbi:DUF1707 domain-containing protein [Pseudonocardia sp. MH-G8]|uniref:DUF1707 domain-containing protein n=1 Tax=Pseudonocardia sp. MH-G8 TaxID=1854588 RepID=UPI000BA12B7F|nr:DUF1707 domain-containing protein [Pseudonocardia sp. MH-G8]OZM75558.1 hypothetical protein CFP66_45720 [Pseudonocardia sp. MH-G8]
MSTPETHGIRIGHDEREAAVRELGEHFSEGRLEPQEYEERMSAAYAARTTDDLAPLFADLPRAQDAATALVAQAPATQWPVAPMAAGPDAAWGLDPVTGRPYSDRSKVAAGLLQLFLPFFGAGRLYSGHTAIGVMQLLLAPLGVGMVWAFIDGIVMLTGEPTDRHGRPLRP